MAISKIKTGSIEDGTLSTADYADSSVTEAKIDPAFVTSINTNPQLAGTSAMLVPKGTTAQRPASPVIGHVRYNTTTDCLEQYTALGWAGIAAPPVITTISPTTFNGETGTTITVNGANFQAGAVVTFITAAGTAYNAGATTYVNSSQLTATTPQDFTVADEPIDVKVTNANGLSTTLADSLDCGGSPTWTTASGNLLDVNETVASTVTIAATDPDNGSTIAYSISSGSLPSGMSLNSSTGVISGTPAEIASDTTYSFTGVATDNAGNTASRSFNIIIRNAVRGIVIGGTTYSLESTAQSFTTQGYYSFTVPKSFQARLQLWGAGGGGAFSGSSGPSKGCAGGYVEGLYTFSPGVTYVMLIGQGGRIAGNPTGRAFPDGGQSEQNEGYGMAGGGGSTRFGLYAQSGFNITNSSGNYNNTSAVYNLIAGAGAGGSDYIYTYGGTPAGYGGGTNGADGGAWYTSGESSNSTGKGGTQSAGGAAGTTPARLAFAEAGGKYYGGNGSGSGGGGGYYGGGGARGYYSLGGGGSGFIGSGITSGTFYTATAGESTHYISPNPRSNRPGSAGYGGAYGNAGNDGAVIFTLV